MEIKSESILVDEHPPLLRPDGSRFVAPLSKFYEIDLEDRLLSPGRMLETKTAHGVGMTPLFQQFQTMIKHAGIALGTFSTDQCVEREIGKLEALERKLLGAGYSVARWCMVEQLRNLMKRRPANRSENEVPYGGTAKAKPVGQKAPTGQNATPPPPAQPATEAPKVEDEPARGSLLEID